MVASQVRASHVRTTRGLLLVDTGTERVLRDRPGQAAFRGLVAEHPGVDVRLGHQR